MNNLLSQIKQAYKELAEDYKKRGIKIVMVSVVPQRGHMLEKVARLGIDTAIAGGITGQQLYPNVRQYTLPYDTTAEPPNAETAKKIVGALPKGLSRNLALFTYESSGTDYSKILAEYTGSNIVASNESRLRGYFEEKANLSTILEAAGLQNHMIPSIQRQLPIDRTEAEAIYSRLKDESGKIVVQSCGPEITDSVAGKGTSIIDNMGEWVGLATTSKLYVKTAKYIDGYDMNVSLLAGNTLPNKKGYGLTRTHLSKQDDLCSPNTLKSLVQRASALGIDNSNTIVIAGKPTLKVVGEPRLTHSPTNGVGNVVNYKFDESISNQVEHITKRVGQVLARSGKVGLAGIDFIVKNGRVYVNEINDRQQGTTAPFSELAEKYGSAGLCDIDFLLQYANLNGKQNLLQSIKANSSTLYRSLADKPEFVYAKIVARDDYIAKRALKSGVYQINEDLNLQKAVGVTQPNGKTDITNLPTQIEVNGCDLQIGQKIQKRSQIMRIQGEVDTKKSPFILKNNKAVLNQMWYPFIDNLYSQLFIKEKLSQKMIGGISEQNIDGNVESGQNVGGS